MKWLLACIISLILAVPAIAAAEVRLGDPAPGFALNAMDGSKVNLSDYKGKVVVIGFVDNCPPCVAQAQELETLRRQYIKNPKLAVVGIVSQDKGGTDKLLRKMNPKAQYPLLLDPNMSVQKAYGLRGDPQIVIVDQKGMVAFKSYLISSSKLAEETDKLLK